MRDLKKAILYGAICYSEMAFAGVEQDLNALFDKMGAAGNVSSGGYYQSQSAGYYGGGSVFMRTPARNATLFDVQMPDLRMGCGNIDMFAGAFSHINSENLIRMLRSIGSNAATFGFQIALQTVTPQIKTTLDYLNSLMQEVNNMNMNSCDLAATAVGAIWPRTEASSKVLCKNLSTAQGDAADWAKARQHCGIEGRGATTNAKKSDNANFKDQLGDQYNLAWQAIQKSGMHDFANSTFAFAGEDNAIAELFMSISGTFISKLEGGRMEHKHYPSLLEDEALLDLLIRGEPAKEKKSKTEQAKLIQKVNIYQCKEKKECLEIIKNPVVIKKEEAVLPRVRKLIQSMRGKIRGESVITDQEKAFVNATSLPILKMLAVEMAYIQDAAPISVDRFAYEISYDIVLNYLSQVLSIISDGLIDIKNVQISAIQIEEFIQDVRRVRDLIHQKRQSLHQQVSANFAAITKTKQIEQQLFYLFSNRNEGQL